VNGASEPDRFGAVAICGVAPVAGCGSGADRDTGAVGPSQPADDGYYIHATRRSVTGISGEIEQAVRLHNAVVTVEFRGADLTLNPALPRGAQLVTTAVPESRLRPVVESLLPGAIGLLR
jgi:hypothetical protein